MSGALVIMSQDPDFRIGDRIRINPALAERYVQPWRDRVRKGLFGTITGGGSRSGWFIQLDMPRRAKRDQDWRWGSVRNDEILPVAREDAHG